MKRSVESSEAKRVLGRTSLEESFWLCTNENLRSLAALSKALEDIDDNVFRYHVNRDKNDFEAWIRDIIKDKELAREISRVKTKETLVRKISERVDALTRVAQVSHPRKAKKSP